MSQEIKTGLHPRSRFRFRYDFPALAAACPSLGPFVAVNEHGEPSINYADPLAVKALNQALLSHAYGLVHWGIPAGFLCPPVPGRSDYIHYLADLISGRRGASVRVLDVGTGASVIYPLIGVCEYDWSFVGAELDLASLRWARQVVALHPRVAGRIDLRLQKSAWQCFGGIIHPGESFDLTMCNPPFHASAAEAAAGTQRKLRNLRQKRQVLNFGGKAGELWCEGGELGFIQRMISESRVFAGQVGWFTTLVSKSAHLPKLQEALRRSEAVESRVIDMAQGQKKSRILAWRWSRLGFR